MRLALHLQMRSSLALRSESRLTVTVSLLRADGQERVVEFPRGLQVPSASPRHLPAKAVAGLCQGRVPGGGRYDVGEHCAFWCLRRKGGQGALFKGVTVPASGSGPSPLSPPVLECLFLDLEKEGFGPDVTPRGPFS